MTAFGKFIVNTVLKFGAAEFPQHVSESIIFPMEAQTSQARKIRALVEKKGVGCSEMMKMVATLPTLFTSLKVTALPEDILGASMAALAPSKIAVAQSYKVNATTKWQEKTDRAFPKKEDVESSCIDDASTGVDSNDDSEARTQCAQSFSSASNLCDTTSYRRNSDAFQSGPQSIVTDLFKAIHSDAITFVPEEAAIDM